MSRFRWKNWLRFDELTSRRSRPKAARLHLEALEDRSVPSVATTFVNDNWNLIADTDSTGSLTTGDLVENNNDANFPASTIIVPYGTVGFGTVTTSSVPGVTGIPGSVPAAAMIHDAVTNTTAGGTVNVLDGTYDGGNVIDKSVRVVGANRPDITTGSFGDGRTGGFEVRANDVTIEGFDLVGGTTDNEFGILLADSAGPSFSGATIRDNTFTGYLNHILVATGTNNATGR